MDKDANNKYDQYLEDIIAKLIAEAKLKSALESVVVIIMCKTLLRKTKHDPALYAAAKKKVLATLEQMSIYKEYMQKLSTEN